MHICTACVASSGTATLETALMELPTVLVYKLAPVTWFLANLLVHVKYAGLPNLLLNREVTPELLQDRANADNIVSILLPWLEDDKKGKRMWKKSGKCGKPLDPAELSIGWPSLL